MTCFVHSVGMSVQGSGDAHLCPGHGKTAKEPEVILAIGSTQLGSKSGDAGTEYVANIKVRIAQLEDPDKDSKSEGDQKRNADKDSKSSSAAKNNKHLLK